MNRLYVYALADERVRTLALHGHTIEAVKIGGIYALAERADRMPDLSEASLREQHAIVIELARRASAILPARFGALVDRGELEQIVGLRRDTLRDALTLVRGREQMTVRLIGDDGSPKTAGSAGAPYGAGTRYLAERRAAAGYPLPDAVARLNAAMTDQICAARAEPGNGRERAVVYHLIEQSTSAAYRRRLARAAQDTAPFSLEASGPWPPFAFAPELVA